MALELGSRGESDAVTESQAARGPRPDQGGCVLLDKVPAELRCEIYRFLFGNAPVHLVYVSETVTHVRCHESWNCRHVEARNGRGKKNSRPQLPSSLTTHAAILRTCRRIYNEAVPILYSSLIFQVTNFEAWICFSSQVRPQSLISIRHPRASWESLSHQKDGPWHRPLAYAKYKSTFGDGVYEYFWHLVATKMTGLVDLTLLMHYPTELLDRSADSDWHQPLQNVRGLRTFTLEIRDRGDMSSPDTLALIQLLRETMCSPR